MWRYTVLKVGRRIQWTPWFCYSASTIILFYLPTPHPILWVYYSALYLTCRCTPCRKVSQDSSPADQALNTHMVAQVVKNLPAGWKTWVWSLGWEDPPGEENGYLLQYCLEKSTDSRSLVGCSLWGHKDWDTTERLALAFTLNTHIQTHVIRSSHLMKLIRNPY